MNYSINYLFRFATANLGSLTAATAAATAMAGAMTKAGTAVAALGVASAAAMAGGIGFMVSATREAAKFEKAMSNVRKVLPDMSKEEMWASGKDAQKIAFDLAMRTDKVADVMASVARAGVHEKAAMESLTRIGVSAAKTWDDVNASTAATSLAFISGKFFGDLSADQAKDKMLSVADAINYLGQNARGVKPGQLLKFFDNVGAEMSRFGLTAEQSSAFGAVALLSGQGMGGLNEGTRAASAMGRLMDAATAPKKAQVAALKALKLTPKMWGQMLLKDPQEALLYAFEGVQGMNKLGKTKVMQDLIGDKRAGRQMARMADRLNEYKRALAMVDTKYAQRFVNEKKFMDWMEKAYPKQAKLLREKQKALHHGSMAQEISVALDNFEDQAERLGIAFDTLQQNMGKSVLPYATPIVSWLAEMVNNMAQSETMVSGLATSLAVLGSGAILAGVGLLTAKLLGLYKTGSMALRIVGGLFKFTKGALILSVVIGGITGLRWLYNNWENIKKLAQDKIYFNIEWPNAPDWLQKLWDWMGWGGVGAVGDVDPALLGMKSPDISRLESRQGGPYRVGALGMPILSDHARKMADEAARYRDRIAESMPVTQARQRGFWEGQLYGPNNKDTTWDNAFSRATPYGSTSAIPSAMNVGVSIEPVTFQPATITINAPPGVAPDSVSLQANPARGQSTAQAGGGSGTPYAQ